MLNILKKQLGGDKQAANNRAALDAFFDADNAVIETKLVEKIEKPVSRENGANSLSPSFPDTKTEKLLQKYNNFETKIVKRGCADTERARRIAVKILTKKKTVVAVLDSLLKDGVKSAPVIIALHRIANSIEPAKLVTAKDLQDIAGSKPDNVSVKWWNESFPILVDIAGLTVKRSRTERYFPELFELENSCYVVDNVCQKIGDSLSVLSDRLGGRLINSDPFIERTKNGEIIKHERPEQTAEGKEAARQAQLAMYLKQQHELKLRSEILEDAEFSQHNYMHVLKSYKGAGIGLAFVLLLAVGAVAENVGKKEINPTVEQAAFSVDDIIEADFGYLNDE